MWNCLTSQLRLASLTKQCFAGFKSQNISYIYMFVSVFCAVWTMLYFYIYTSAIVIGN